MTNLDSRFRSERDADRRSLRRSAQRDSGRTFCPVVNGLQRCIRGLQAVDVVAAGHRPTRRPAGIVGLGLEGGATNRGVVMGAGPEVLGRAGSHTLVLDRPL